MKIMRTLFVGVASVAALGLSSPLLAHAKLVSSNPAAHAVVAAPAAITLKFNERVVPAFTKLDVSMPQHGMKVPVKVTVAPDGKTVSGVPQKRLSKGAYHVVWTAASADGHKMSGNIDFTVR
jgi:methionine-rich copper-binding protein CopC